MMDEYLRVFRAFSDEKRLKVLEILTGGEKCACDLLKELNISQPTLSYHMKVLAQAGIVKSRPVGPWKYYSIDRDGCAYARKLLKALEEGKAGSAKRFARILRRLSLPSRSTGRALACASRVLYGFAPETI